MVLSTLCNGCHERFDIIVAPDSGHLIAQLANEEGVTECPRHCGGKILLTGGEAMQLLAAAETGPHTHLNAVELYRAIHGAGLPDEIPKSGELVEAMLKTHKVKDATVEEVGDRIYLHELVLENGSIIHLTAGGRGAQVLKVTRAT